MLWFNLLLCSLVFHSYAAVTNDTNPVPTVGLLYPFASETREVQTLNGIWRFATSNATTFETIEKWYLTDLDNATTTIAMPVPSSYNDITTDEDLRDHVGGVWYQRKFFVPKRWINDTRIWLRFSSVYYSAVVWLNGIEVTNHSIGYLPFEVDISDTVKYGTENRLTVLCNNTLTVNTVPQGQLANVSTDTGYKIYQTYTFDFFNYAGIDRPVLLYTTPLVYIKDIKITTDVDFGTPDIYNMEVDVGMVNYTILISSCSSTNISGLYYLNLVLRDKNDYIIVMQNCTKSPFTGTILVENPELWWPYLMNTEYGYLYTLEIYLYATGAPNTPLDVYRTKVGIRKIEWSNTTYLVNKQQVYLRGFGRHEDSELRGKGLDYPLLARDFNLIKWIGANAYRTSHYPYSEESMQFAEENGIMIIDECSSVNTNFFGPELLHNHKSALEQLIHRDRNYACVLMWSIANEPRTQFNNSVPYFNEIVKYTKTLTPLRPLTAALNVQIDQEKLAQFLDIICVNRYYGWYVNPGHLGMITNYVINDMTAWWQKYQRPVMMTEYGAGAIPGFHTLPPTLYTEDYQVLLLGKHFEAFDNLRAQNWFMGEFVWNFADFNTAQKTDRAGRNRKGLFERNRQPKAGANAVRKRYVTLASEFNECELPKDLLF